MRVNGAEPARCAHTDTVRADSCAHLPPRIRARMWNYTRAVAVRRKYTAGGIFPRARASLLSRRIYRDKLRRSLLLRSEMCTLSSNIRRNENVERPENTALRCNVRNSSEISRVNRGFVATDHPTCRRRRGILSHPLRGIVHFVQRATQCLTEWKRNGTAHRAALSRRRNCITTVER